MLVNDTTIFLATAALDTNSTPQLQTWTLADSGKFIRLGSGPLDASAQKLAIFGQLLAAQEANQVQLFDVTTPASPNSLGGGGPDGCVYFDLDQADGALQGGVWLPLGMYGVDRVRAQ